MNCVVLFGAYGFGNLGDELLAGYYRGLLFQAFPKAKRICLTADPYQEEGLPGEIFRPRWQVPHLLTTVCPGDLWVAGGGSLLQNVSSRRSLAYYLGLIELAHRRGAKVALLGQGYGLITGEFWRSAIKKALSRVGFVEARDEPAWSALREMAIEPSRLGQVVDPVWSFPVPDLISRGEDGLVILRREDQRAAGELMSILSLIRPTGNIRVVAFSSCDEPVLRRICGKRFHGRITSLSGFWEVLQGVGFVVSSRLHGLIPSALAGIPVLGFGRDPKIHAICEALGAENITPEDLVTHQKAMTLEHLDHRRQFEQAQDLHARALQDREKTLALLQRLGVEE